MLLIDNTGFAGFLAYPVHMFGLSRRIFAMAKATGFKFGTLIDQVSTNQKTEIYPQKGRGLSLVIYI